MQTSRFELKYVFNEETALQIREFARFHLELDAHSVGKFSYPVHSLYLDSDALLTYWNTIHGERNRFKLRIRFYDEDPESPVFLEVKHRVNDSIKKRRAGVGRETVSRILTGQLLDAANIGLGEPKHPIEMNEFVRLMRQVQARPKLHVAYLREAYMSREDNSTRLTFDRDVRSEPDLEVRLSTHMRNPRVTWGKAVVLELKFANRFPDCFGELVRRFKLKPSRAANYVDGLAHHCRIQSLAQIGLVFLIFNIGQGIKLQRLKKVGLPLVLATVIIAVMVLVGCRLLGAALGWPGEYSLVLGGMLMISSTAVLGKSLLEAKATHSRFGQTALTVTALDDLVAVVMLTVLTSIIQVGQADSLAVFGTVVRLKAVIITMAIGALLLVPPLLKRLGRDVSSEVRSLVIVGLLLAMALLSAKAGFSAALGAFLLGTIVSSTGRSEQVERALAGLCEVFAPVFFVAMGMLFDFNLLAEVWPLALGVFFIAVVWRMIAATTALLMVGHPMGDAARAALCLTPIGEFSLIIALTAVQGGLVPPSFYALAVGVCLLTSLTTPFLIRKSQAISDRIERKQPEFLAQWIGFYGDWIESLKQRQRASMVWKLTAPRFVQVTLSVLFISGLLIFAQPLYVLAEKWLGADWPMTNGLPLIFWFGFGLLLLAPLIALWRNVEALAMICAESATHGRAKRSVLQPLFEKLLKGSAFIAIVAWLAALVPYRIFPLWGFIALAVAFVALAAVFWRQLIRLHSRFEIDLRSQLADSPFADGKPQLAGWPKRNGQWKMNLSECTIEENSQAVARPISELPLRPSFSCTIVSIERQGVTIPNPAADTILYPNDKVLLLGRDEDLRRAERWLNTEAETAAVRSEEPKLADLSLEHLAVPAGSRHVGKPLGDLALHSRFGIQIVGIERNQLPALSPGRSETLQSGDQLLVFGTPEQVNEMGFWLST